MPRFASAVGQALGLAGLLHTASPTLLPTVAPDNASGAELGFCAAVGFVSAAESELN